jgi:Ca-activated chloride channel homolog
MKALTIPILWLACFVSAISQTSLQGKVTDAESGEPIILGTVALYKNGVVVTGTETDFDGFYSINELDPGTYDVVFSYTGYTETRITGVGVSAGKANRLDAKMSAGVTLEEVVVKYERPIIHQDNTTQGSTLSSEQIRNLPTRSANGQSRKKKSKAEEGNATNIRGSRSDATNYYIDGVRVSGGKVTAPPPHDPTGPQDGHNTEDYAHIAENEFKSPVQEPLSTFSIDVDKASYANVRRFLNANQLPPKDAVRIEEMINYFDFDYEKPKGDVPFSVTTELSSCNWKDGHLLLHIGLQGRQMEMKNAPPSNLTFLIDVSGSMKSANKLDLVKPALRLLVNELRAEDRVAIVVYAGAAGLVLPSTAGNEKEKIIGAINNLEAGGSTAGAAGIQLAYQVAKENFIENGNNRVILATDGDFNIGVSSDGELTRLIEEKRKDGIYLTCLGFGMGNYKDNKLEILADKGNGNYAYIDNLLEAKKAFVTGLTGTLFVIAQDVKIQVEFNPHIVEAYRLVGYENRLLAKEDFNDDKKDAGEIGAGHSVTALYEIVPKDLPFDFAGKNVDSLKYQATALTPAASSSFEIATVKLRYKQPGQQTSQLISQTVENRWRAFARASTNLQWAGSVAAFGMLLRDSPFLENLKPEDVILSAKQSIGPDKNGDRAECLKLMEAARLLKSVAGN